MADGGGRRPHHLWEHVSLSQKQAKGYPNHSGNAGSGSGRHPAEYKPNEGKVMECVSADRSSFHLVGPIHYLCGLAVRTQSKA